MLRNGTKDRIQLTDSQCVMYWYGDTLMRWNGRFKDDVASDLMHPKVLLVLAEDICEFLAREIAGDLHPTDRTSSRLR